MEEKKKLSELNEEEQKEALKDFNKKHKDLYRRIFVCIFSVLVILLMVFALLYPIFANK